MPTNRKAELQLRGRAGPLHGRVYWPGPQASVHARLLVFCSVADEDAWCQRLSVSSGLMVFSVTCGAGLGDAIDAAEWAAENTVRLGGDPGQLLIGGIGAGGDLAAAAAVHAHASRWPRFSRQVLICASPAVRPLPGMAAATVVTVEHDPGGDGGRYAAALRNAGVSVDETRYATRDQESALRVRNSHLLLADLAAMLSEQET